jgi:hypothetical protein
MLLASSSSSSDDVVLYFSMPRKRVEGKKCNNNFAPFNLNAAAAEKIPS